MDAQKLSLAELDFERWRRCCHEAGHALTARLLGIAVGYASVRRNRSRTTWDSRIDPADDIRTLLAGHRGEMLLFGNADAHGSSADAATIRHLMRQNGFAGFEVIAMRCEVDELLGRHRDDLRTVARALDYRTVLTGREIDALVCPFLKPHA